MDDPELAALWEREYVSLKFTVTSLRAKNVSADGDVFMVRPRTCRAGISFGTSRLDTALSSISVLLVGRRTSILNVHLRSVDGS